MSISTAVCTENLVRIDLMRESLNVGHDGRADISLRAGIYKDRRVIDEFERVKDTSERMLFADFIKQVGDQSVPIKLIFCGIGSALSDLLDAHHSCYRYLTAIPLERLGYQPRLEIIEGASG